MLRGWLISIALAPWLTLLPLTGPAAVLARALVVVAALHGAGVIVARLVGQRLSPVLALQIGTAALLAMGGLATALGCFTLATQLILLHGFAAVHTATIGLRFATYRDELLALGPRRRNWLVPALVLGAIGALHVAGAAGDVNARPFDDDGHILAQLQRLRDTGSLADAIGYARGSHLGAQLVIDAFATAATDVHAFRIADAIAFVLALTLVSHRINPRDTTTGLWILLVILGATALAYVPDDAAPAWTAIGLTVALHALIADDRPALLIGLVAGALVVLRFELAPIGATGLVAAWWPQRTTHRRTAWLLVGLLVVVLPSGIASIAAWWNIPSSVHALLMPSRGSLLVKLAIAAGVSIPAIALVLAFVSDRGLRWLFIAATLAAAGIVAEVTGPRPYAMRFLWPIGIACVLVAAIELVPGRRLAVASLIVSLAVTVLVTEAQVATGRSRWTRRTLDLVYHLEYLRHTDDAPITGGYRTLLDAVPVGATVAVWVGRPERLDYARHRIVDLRTPRVARLRVHRFRAHRSRLAQLVEAAGATHLLIEVDDRHLARMADAGYREACRTRGPDCDDDLETLASHGSVVATAPGLKLVALPGRYEP